MSGHQGDKWHQKCLTLGSGDYVIGFEAIATATDKHPMIGIDDVKLNGGQCQQNGSFSINVKNNHH